MSDHVVNSKTPNMDVTLSDAQVSNRAPAPQTRGPTAAPGASMYAGLVGRKRQREAPEASSSSTSNDNTAAAQALNNRRLAPVRKPRRLTKAKYSEYKLVSTRIGTSENNSYEPSEWYTNINADKPIKNRSNLYDLTRVNQLIKDCILAHDYEENVADTFQKLRTQVHQMDCSTKFDFVFKEKALVKRSKVLEPGGLAEIFGGDDSAIFPYDIIADSEALWVRWMKGNTDPHMLRGINTGKGKLEGSGMSRTNYMFEPNYPFKRSSDVAGNNLLANGQWWPLRLCAIRDGAHGEQEAGISGKKGIGAFSVVVASGGYADVDNGTTILYCGTESKDTTPTRSTALMLESHANQQAVRVLRAVNRKSKYAPAEGIRYDGLYNITDKVCLKEENAFWRFTLERCEGQDPIRWEGVERRPSAVELAERSKIKGLLAGMA